MAQRIQALLNAGSCLIISREGLSMVPQKKRRECESEKRGRPKKCREKIEGKEEPDLAGVTGEGKKRARKTHPCGHVIPLLRWLSCV